MLQMCLKCEYCEYYKCDWNIDIENVTMKYAYWEYCKIWIMIILQIWLKYEHWEYYKYNWNMNIDNVITVTEILILWILQMLLKYNLW